MNSAKANGDSHQAETIQHALESSVAQDGPVQKRPRYQNKGVAVPGQTHKRDKKNSGQPHADEDRSQLLGHLSRQYYKKMGTRGSSGSRPQASHWYSGQI